MQYTVAKPVGRFTAGTVVSDIDFINGRAEELAARGVLVPSEGDLAVPGDDDLGGWKRHAAALASENARLRQATPAAEHAVKMDDLQKENADLTGKIALLQNANAELSEGSVPRSKYQNLADKHTQLEQLHKTTVAELKKHTGK